MKLRFHNQSLRLRLSQSEVARLVETGAVRETLPFPGGQTLEYSLETGPVSAIAASFEDGRITVKLPATEARGWAESDRVGIETADGPLRLYIEKDFQCLHGPEKDNADAFPNPSAAR